MENTLEKSKMALDHDREVYISSKGSLNILLEELSKNNINLSIVEILQNLPIYIINLTERQQTVFKAYYLRQMSIGDIRIYFKFNAIKDVERCLSSATKKYIKLLKEEL